MTVFNCWRCGKEVDHKLHSDECPHEALPPTSQGPTLFPVSQPKKEKLRIVTTVGWFDMDKPTDGFKMQDLVRGIKADGYAVTEYLFVPWEHIVTIFVYPVDRPPPSDDKGVVIDFPGGPKAS